MCHSERFLLTWQCMVKHVPHYLYWCRTRGSIQLLRKLIFFPRSSFKQSSLANWTQGSKNLNLRLGITKYSVICMNLSLTHWDSTSFDCESTGTASCILMSLTNVYGAVRIITTHKKGPTGFFLFFFPKTSREAASRGTREKRRIVKRSP